jgi:hypothetical protein
VADAFGDAAFPHGAYEYAAALFVLKEKRDFLFAGFGPVVFILGKGLVKADIAGFHIVKVGNGLEETGTVKVCKLFLKKAHALAQKFSLVGGLGKFPGMGVFNKTISTPPAPLGIPQPWLPLP